MSARRLRSDDARGFGGEFSAKVLPVRCDGKQFVVRADELLTAFLELGNALGSDFDERFDKCRITFI